jgi:flagellin-like protein
MNHPAKGITPIISIIVLLLITVVLAGSGWVYLTAYSEIMTKIIDLPPGATSCSGTKATVIIRNPSQSAINNSKHKVMLEGQLTPACLCLDNTCRCGDLTVTRTSGEDYF